MYRSLLILGPLLFLNISGVHAFAQDEHLWDSSLEELLDVKIYSAARRETLALSSPSFVSVLTAEELGKWGAENLADALRLTSGVIVRKAPGDFPQYQVEIRGNTSDFMNIRTLFLIDGVPVRNPNAGFDPSWIPLSVVKRVEIVKGPASSIWGANAFGGLVNIITKSGSDMKRPVELSAQYNFRQDPVTDGYLGGFAGTATYGKAEPKVSYIASAQYFHAADSNESYSGHQYRDVFGRTSYQVHENFNMTLTGLFSFDQNQIAVTNADTPIENNFSHLTASAEWRLDTTTTLKMTAFHNAFEHDLSYTDDLEIYSNKSQSHGINTQYNTTFQENHAVDVGLDWIGETGSLDTYEYDYSTSPPEVNAAGWSRQYQRTIAVFSQYEFLGWEKLRPIAGIRYDSNSLYGDALSPRIAVSLLATSSLSLYSSIGKGFRAPVFNETHISGFGKIGNPNLEPEISTTYEVGVKSVLPGFQNTAAIFREDITDNIELTSTTPAEYENRSKASIQGLELEGVFTFENFFRTFYNATFLESDDGTGDRIEKVIKTQFTLGCDFHVDSWKLGVVGAYYGDQFYYNTNDSIPDDDQDRVFVPSFLLGHLFLSKEITQNLEGHIYVNNIGNHQYKESFSPFIVQNGLYLPGRKIGLSLKGRF